MKSPHDVLDTIKFYKEIAKSGIEYCPPAKFFDDTEKAIQDLIKQVNDLRIILNQHQSNTEE